MVDIQDAGNDVVKIYELLDNIIEINQEMFLAGLITSTGGNVSARLSNRPDEIWITPRKKYKGGLQTKDLVPINLRGELLNDYAVIASSERYVHCEIMNTRSDINAVIHTHAPNISVLDLANIPFMPISPEATFLGVIPTVPFIMPGTNDLGVAVSSAMGDGNAVIMQNHGLVVAGVNLRQAADITHIIEETSKKILESYEMGISPRTLSDEMVAKIQEGKKMVG